MPVICYKGACHMDCRPPETFYACPSPFKWRHLEPEIIINWLRVSDTAERSQVDQPIALQRHLTHGLPYMLLRDVVIAHFSRPPWGPICPWESPPLTCRPLGHQSAALVPARSWTRPGSAAHGGLLR